jgi:DNA-binding CsgD family transcriptional regulator
LRESIASDLFAGLLHAQALPQRQRLKANRHQKRALELVAAGQSYREVGLRLDISKNTVRAIVKRHRAKQAGP